MKQDADSRILFFFVCCVGGSGIQSSAGWGIRLSLRGLRASAQVALPLIELLDLMPLRVARIRAERFPCDVPARDASWARLRHELSAQRDSEQAEFDVPVNLLAQCGKKLLT